MSTTYFKLPNSYICMHIFIHSITFDGHCVHGFIMQYRYYASHFHFLLSSAYQIFLMVSVSLCLCMYGFMMLFLVYILQYILGFLFCVVR